MRIVPILQKQGVHPLNPPASQGKYKAAFGRRLAPYPPPGTRHVASRLTGWDPTNEGGPRAANLCTNTQLLSPLRLTIHIVC
ncbi:hypothetical protein Y032_0159g3275 [Ancylostoma ceylanicum]|uniref:Uncharacterized protein n=1 Tax=Ancylostoma ceylanicum TaxID=53326 RepID=A0A016SXI6_9BILA|nr:hypothetical protein Y032_0159g3275 [Ancylostoma ceylanicum]